MICKITTKRSKIKKTDVRNCFIALKRSKTTQLLHKSAAKRSKPRQFPKKVTIQRWKITHFASKIALKESEILFFFNYSLFIYCSNLKQNFSPKKIHRL
jgi:hypothetical protein